MNLHSKSPKNSTISILNVKLNDYITTQVVSSSQPSITSVKVRHLDNVGVGIGGVSAEADSQCIPELHCAVARDTRHGTGRDETRRGSSSGMQKNSMRAGGEKGEEARIKLERREKERTTATPETMNKRGQERKETRVQRDSVLDRNERGSGRIGIVFSPLGSRTTRRTGGE